MQRLVTMLIATSVLLFGCAGSAPKIDASSDETLRTSIAEVRASLPENQRTEFDDAIQVVMLSEIDLMKLFAAGSSGSAILEAKAKEAVHGKTGAEIIASAKSLKAESEKKLQEQALQEIAELEARRVAKAAADEELKRFEVLRSRFYVKKDLFIDRKIMELTVRNGTAHPVSRVYFHGTVSSPGRSVPWIQDQFNYSIPGGLEPGEEASWQLEPFLFGSNVALPADAVFTATAYRLDGADGKPLFDLQVFSKSDEERLAELKAKYR